MPVTITAADAKLVKTYREMFAAQSGEEGTDRKLSLPVAQVLEIIRSVEGDDDSEDTRMTLLEAAQDVLDANDETVNKPPVPADATEAAALNVTGKGVKAHAIELAAKISDATRTMIGDLAAKRAEVGAGPITIYERLLADFGPEGMAAFPVPDTPEYRDIRQEDGTIHKIKHNNPDKYSTWSITTDGTKKETKGTFYGDLYDATPEGIAAATTLRELRDAKAKKEGAPKQYCDPQMGKTERNGEIRYWAGVITNGRKLYRQGAAIFFKLAALNELAHVRAKISNRRLQRKTTTEKFIRDPKPFVVYDPKNAEDALEYGLGQFLKLKPELATDGTLETLLNASPADSGGDDNEGGDTDHTVEVTNKMGVEKLVDALSLIQSWGDTDDTAGAVNMAKLDKLMSKDATVKDNVREFITMFALPLYNKHFNEAAKVTKAKLA